MLVRPMPLPEMPELTASKARCPMTFNTFTFYCKRCKEPTPHEMSEDGQRARCIICTNKQRSLALESEQFSNEARHWSALDGMGNRGEPAPPDWATKRKEKT